MMKLRIIVSLTALMAARLVHAGDTSSTKELIANAGEGDMAAQLSLAYRYRDGKGVKRDYAEAMRWAHLAADRGNAEAMDFVGWMFFQGLGVKHDPAIAAGYFKCNPAIPSPGLQLMTAEDLKRYWRSDHYGEVSNGVLSRPAIAIDAPQCRNN